MSEQKNSSPLLDGFTIGSPMSDHDGVRCCPAIKDNSENKFIVKIISVPATQAQMDALLLAGAYKDPADAMDYYKEQAEDVCKEAQLLQTLSQKHGFLPYDGWHIEPITKRRLGYEVYLLGTYKRSLEKHLHKNPVTHLEAFNMAIDVCDALDASRQAGSLYVDLKPSNIFMSDQKEYRIGDLGFLALDALSYTTLPNKYRSAYTPPEFEDPMSPLNTTADTYALGMILYQLYNDSRLPSSEDLANGTVPSPVNADYELADIIMTAIHTDPEQRWLEPSAMRQALVSYMQRNAVNDVAITPHVPLDVKEEMPDTSEKNPEDSLPATSEDAEPHSTEEEPAGLDDGQRDDSAPGEEDADLLQPHEMSEELSKMVAKADDLIAHETPEGLVVPEAPEIPDPFAFVKEDSDEIDDSDIPVDPLMDEEPEADAKPVKKKKKTNRFVSPEHKRRVRQFWTTLLFLAASGAVGFCCYLYYQLFYLIPVENITIQGSDQRMTVTVDTEADLSLVKVICSDEAGNFHSGSFQNGAATLTDLLPKTTYTVSLEIEGFHKLSGETTAVYTTEANTKVVSFTAVNGPQDGSFLLNFTTDGEEPDEWSVICSAEGEEDLRQTFTGHSILIKGLTVGKVYTLTLMTEDGLTVSGNTVIECLASRQILAEDLTVTAKNETDMVIHWRAPGDVVVDSWNVRCYNNQGFEDQFTVDDTSVVIHVPDVTAGFTFEITASGMSQPARFSITKDPIVIQNFTIENLEDPTADQLKLQWEFTGAAPKDGWLLMYTVDGAATPSVIKCKEPSAVIEPRIPGAKYRFSIQSANGTSVINCSYDCECPDALPFEMNGLSAENVTARLLKTPEQGNWRYETIKDSDFTDSFAVGDKISVVLQAGSPFYLPGQDIYVLYVYTDAHGNALSGLAQQEKLRWTGIWQGGDAKTGELDVPIAPDAPGSYLLNIYVDGMAMVQVPLTIQ